MTNSSPWLTVSHGFSMALIEIGGLPVNSMVIFIDFPWQSVSHNQQMVYPMISP